MLFVVFIVFMFIESGECDFCSGFELNERVNTFAHKTKERKRDGVSAQPAHAIQISHGYCWPCPSICTFSTQNNRPQNELYKLNAYLFFYRMKKLSRWKKERRIANHVRNVVLVAPHYLIVCYWFWVDILFEFGSESKRIEMNISEENKTFFLSLFLDLSVALLSRKPKFVCFVAHTHACAAQAII